MKIKELLQKYEIKNPSCGAYCGDGWVPLIESLIVDLIAFGWDKQLGQVKEKFGGLRFYLDGETTDDINKRISEAESQSFKVCEACGNPGSDKGSTAWISTLCDDCRKK